MRRAYEAGPEELTAHLDEFIAAVFGDLTSSFLVMPKGPSFVDYPRFRQAYEVLKRRTSGFTSFHEEQVWNAVREDALSLLVVRTMLGMTPPEWAEIARQETGEAITSGFARTLDNGIRADPAAMGNRLLNGHTERRLRTLIRTACVHLTASVPEGADDTVHRLNRSEEH